MSAATAPTSMREHPIIFSGPMVRAILDGTKTQTRRIVKPQPERRDGAWYWASPRYNNGDGVHYFHTVEITASLEKAWAHACPYGVPGDRLWVRETWWCLRGQKIKGTPLGEPQLGGFVANGEPVYAGVYRRVPTIHMPRWASRLTLEVTEVRVQRLQEISEEDAWAEGIGDADVGPLTIDGRVLFASSWDSINGKRAPWASNPWVWAITFRRAA